MSIEIENKSEITFLVEDLEVVLEMNKLLEKENQELRNEVTKLKSQVNALKAHDIERKSILWKKIQFPGNINKETVNQKQTITEQKFVVSESLKKKTDSSLVHQISPNPMLKVPPPPPPPPLPSKSFVGSKFALRRVPEVIEFYRYLNTRNALMESKSNVTTTSVEGNNPRNMIGEIENRSTYLTAVKSDVATQSEFIKFLTQEVETIAFAEIAAVEAFVKWLDGELSSLVDERAVLKHFPQWPEKKADAMREASCTYKDLKNLESEVLSYHDNPKTPLAQSLRRIQTLQDRLERTISNMERTREGTCKRYKELQIPWDWMLETGLVGQIKYSSLRLVKEYIKRIIKELQDNKCSIVEDDIVLQGARYCYRVHQFAGGFDLDTKAVFEQLKRIHSANSLH